jgi:hypothetical protein
MRRPLLLAIIVSIALAASSVDAQQQTPTPRRGPPVVKIAKWGLLGVAGGLGLYALHHSTRAEDAYDDLRAICLDAPARCDHGGGRYPDAAAEQLYHRAISEDRRAQLGIFGGQAMLFGSVGLFIYDLRDDRTPATIPYPGRGPGANFVLATIVF